MVVNPPIIRSNPFSGQIQPKSGIPVPIYKMCQIGENLEKENLNWRKSKLGASRKEIRSGRAYGIDALLHHSPPVVTIIQIGLFFWLIHLFETSR